MARAQHRKDIRDEERRADWFLERKHRRGDDGRDKVHTRGWPHSSITEIP